MEGYSVTQSNIFHNFYNQAYNIVPQNSVPKTNHIKNDYFLKSVDPISINLNKNNNENKKKKILVSSFAVLATLALGYTIGIRKFESKFFKNIAKDIKPEEIYLPELKNITKELTLTSKKGNKINAWDVNPNNCDKYIINCNGIDAGKNSQESILKQVKEHNYGLIEFDYCGQGKSTGKFNQEGCLESLDTVIDYLRGKGISNKNIILVGHSLGTGVACDYAKNNTVKGLILIQPFDKFQNVIKANVLKVDSLPKVIKETIHKLPNWIIPIKNKFNNLKALKQIKEPTLIITSRDDEVVHSNLTRNLYEKTKEIGNKKILEFENGGHFVTDEKEKAYFQFIDELFSL